MRFRNWSRFCGAQTVLLFILVPGVPRLAMTAEPQGAAAQTAPALSVATLKHVFDVAWARQPEAKSLDARRTALEAQARTAASLIADDPALELAAKTGRSGHSSGAREVEAAVVLPLWLAGERSRAQALVAAEGGALASRMAAAKWRLAGMVREAWWASQRARQETHIARVRRRNAERLAADVARRVEAGDMARSDQHQAAGAVAAAKAALAEAIASEAQAEQGLVMLLGRPVIVATGHEAEPLPRAAQSATMHPALEELAARADVARRATDLAGVRTRGNPELSVGASQERDAAGEPATRALIVGMRIPFGSSSRGTAKIAAATAEWTEAQALAENELGRIEAEIKAAQVRLSSAESILEAARERARLAAESVAFFDKSFRLGETDLPTRLRVELEAFEAERQSVRAAVDRAEAISRLRQALGLLPE